jgi:hypothetical protein
MKIASYIFVACIAGLAGYLANEVAHQKDYVKCPTYTTKYATWVGYLSYNHNEARCFWVENEYPRRARAELRVKHGLTE